ncbi:hypothetical protein MRX96_042425 [Rhipicephalus microplus]
MQVDTGSPVCVIAEENYRRKAHFLAKLEPTDKTLYCYTGKRPLLGVLKLVVNNPTGETEGELYVTVFPLIPLWSHHPDSWTEQRHLCAGGQFRSGSSDKAEEGTSATCSNVEGQLRLKIASCNLSGGYERNSQWTMD